MRLRTLRRFPSKSYLIVILVFLFFLDGFALWFAARSDYNNTIEKARITLEKAAISLEERVRRTVHSTEAILNGRALRIQEKGIGPTVSSKEEWERFRRAAQTLPDAGSLWLLDDKANLLMDSTEYPSRRMNFSDREYFVPQRDQRIEFYIGPVVKGRITRKYSFTISRRINGKNGSFLGIVLAAIETDDFTNFLRSISLGEGGTVGVFRTDGALIVRQPMKDEFLGKTFSNLTLFGLPLDKEPSGIYETRAMDGVERLIAYRKVQGLPLLAASTIPIDSLLKEWRYRLKSYTLVAVGAFLALAGLSWVVRRTTIREDEERARELSGINQALQAETAQRRQTEKELQRTNERLEMAQRASRAGTWDWDIKANQLEWSPSLFQLFGLDPEERAASFGVWRSILQPEDREIADVKIETALKARDTLSSEYRIVRPDNQETRWINALGQGAYDDQGHPVRMTGICIDITDRKEAEAELQKVYAELERRVEERTIELKEAYLRLETEMSERAKVEDQLRQSQKMHALGTLAGGVAHDFNNILAAIIGFSEMIEEDIPSGNANIQHVRRVINAALRGRDLVQQILTFARKTEHARHLVSLSTLTSESLHLLRPSIPATIEIIFDSAGTSDTILASPVEIQQILMNLAANAALAMKENGGVLRISLTDIEIGPGCPIPEPELVPGSYVQLAVSDTGTGITPEVMERIFEPFYTTREVGQGTGMGLAVVYGIVKSLHGGITVDSKPGEGSTFRILLPRGSPDSGAETSEDGRSQGGGRGRVLFIDDEVSLVEWGQALLDRLGYEVTALSDSAEAFKVFSDDPSYFDIVITDQTMPGITGLALSRELLKIRPDLPIILCTGHSDAVTPDMLEKNGITVFLMKPLTRGELENALRRVLDKASEK